jgi:hypothetical protein
MTRQRVAIGLVLACGVFLGARPADAQSRLASDELKIELERVAEQAAKMRAEVAKTQPEMEAAMKEVARTTAALGADVARLAGPELDNLKRHLEETAVRLKTWTASGAQASPLAGFSVVLVQGSATGNGSTDGIPAAAAKALADLKDFLPYKSYQLLDTQWILGNSRVMGRLQGAGRAFELQLTAPTITPSGVTVSRFILRDAAVAENGEAKAPTPEVAAVAEARRPATPAPQPGPTAGARPVPVAPVKLAALNKLVTMAGTIIDTSFTMAIGETVVVGTSRLPGSSSDQALIVLLTAVGK